MSLLGASPKQDLMSSLSSPITASGTGAFIDSMARLPLVEKTGHVAISFIESRPKNLLFELYLSWGKCERNWPCKCIVIHSMDVPRKLIQMVMSRGMHLRRVGAFWSTARASHGMKMPHRQKFLFFLLKLQNIPCPMTNCECGNVSEPQGFPSIRVSKSASRDSSWLDVAQWWL